MMKLKKSLIILKKQKKNVDREKLIHKIIEYTYSFQNFQTIKTFGRDIYEGKTAIEEADKYQTNLLVAFKNFRKKKKPSSEEKKR